MNCGAGGAGAFCGRVERVGYAEGVAVGFDKVAAFDVRLEGEVGY